MSALIRLLGFVKRSKNRKRVLLAIEKPSLPSEIVRELYGTWSGSRYAVVSRALGELKAKKLVKINNPMDRVGRVYTLTMTGKKVAKLLK